MITFMFTFETKLAAKHTFPSLIAVCFMQNTALIVAAAVMIVSSVRGTILTRLFDFVL